MAAAEPMTDTVQQTAEATPMVTPTAAAVALAAPTLAPTVAPTAEPVAATPVASVSQTGVATDLPVVPIAQGVSALLTVMLGSLWWRSRRPTKRGPTP